MTHLPFIAFVAWLAALCVFDLKSRRLPNALTLGGAGAFLAWRAGFGGAPALVSGLEGGAFCALLLIFPFLLRAAGGGDVKMLFAAGAALGRSRAAGALFWISVSGLVLGATFLAFGRVDKARLVHFARSAFDWRYDRAAGRAALPPKNSERARVPFGLAIAAGSVLELLLPL